MIQADIDARQCLLRILLDFCIKLSYCLFMFEEETIC